MVPDAESVFTTPWALVADADQKRSVGKITQHACSLISVALADVPTHDTNQLQPEASERRGRRGCSPLQCWNHGGQEYLFASTIFPHICACCSLNFNSLSLCCLHTIKTSHSVGTTGSHSEKKHLQACSVVGTACVCVYCCNTHHTLTLVSLVFLSAALSWWA